MPPWYFLPMTSCLGLGLVGESALTVFTRLRPYRFVREQCYLTAQTLNFQRSTATAATKKKSPWDGSGVIEMQMDAQSC